MNSNNATKLYHVVAIRPLAPGKRNHVARSYSVMAANPDDAEAKVRAVETDAEKIVCMYAYDDGLANGICHFVAKDAVKDYRREV